MKKTHKLFYKLVDRFAFRCDMKRRAEVANSRGARYQGECLSREEKSQIKEVWGKWGGRYESFGFYKRFCGFFSPCFVPDDYYDFAEHILNLRWASFFLQHKCHLKYFIPKQNRAETIIQKIDGHIVLEDNTEIPKCEAVKLLKQHPEFVVKIAKGAGVAGGGKGVRKIVLDGIQDKDTFIEDLLSPNDVEFELIVRQNDFLSQFNSDSVNTIRFITLNINQKCTVLSAFLRMGAKGSFVDNLSGGNGVLVGINADGYLNEFGVDKHFEKHYCAPSGLVFKGIQIPDFHSIKQVIIDFHKKIPCANLIGWDITLDRNSVPIVIEINLDSALIEAHQVFNGPVFGDRLDEVKAFIDRRIPIIRHGILTF